MEKEELKELSTEALSKRLSTQKTFGYYMELIIPLCCFASLPFLWKELKVIKAEIESRK